MIARLACPRHRRGRGGGSRRGRRRPPGARPAGPRTQAPTRPPTRRHPRRAVADAASRRSSPGKIEELGTGWRLVDDRERPIRALDSRTTTTVAVAGFADWQVPVRNTKNRPSTATGPSPKVAASGRPRRRRGYLADLSSVRRQRVQTSDFVGVPFCVDDERLEVRLHAAVGSNAVHPRRLGVEAAHRYLAADRAGAGHARSSGSVEMEGSGPDRPERSGRIAHGLPTPCRTPPDPSREEDVARVPPRRRPAARSSPAGPSSTSCGPRRSARTASRGSPGGPLERLLARSASRSPGSPSASLTASTSSST